METFSKQAVHSCDTVTFAELLCMYIEHVFPRDANGSGPTMLICILASYLWACSRKSHVLDVTVSMVLTSVTS